MSHISLSPKRVLSPNIFHSLTHQIFFWQVRTFGDKNIDCQSFCLDKRFLGQASLWNFLLSNLSVSKGNFTLTKWVSFTWNAISSPNIGIGKTYSIIHWDFVSRLTPEGYGLKFGPRCECCKVGPGRWLACWKVVVLLSRGYFSSYPGNRQITAEQVLII